MVVTVHGFCRIWDMDKGRTILSSTSLAEILDPGVTIVWQSITPAGLPIFCLSNNKSFTYSTDMQAWEMLLDNDSALAQLSDTLACAAVQGNLAAPGPLAALLDQMPRKVPLKSARRDLRALGTQTALEWRLQSARALNSPAEYRFYLQQYVHRLVADGAEMKLRDVFEELMDGGKTERIMGISRKALTTELLKVLLNRSNTQKLYAELQKKHDQSISKLPL